MRKTRARTPKRRVETPPDPPEIAPRADQEPIGPGDVVMLPDGGLAAVEKVVGRDAYVIEWQKQVGRGPWIFPISDLVPVS